MVHFVNSPSASAVRLTFGTVCVRNVNSTVLRRAVLTKCTRRRLRHLPTQPKLTFLNRPRVARQLAVGALGRLVLDRGVVGDQHGRHD